VGFNKQARVEGGLQARKSTIPKLLLLKTERMKYGGFDRGDRGEAADCYDTSLES
jgi:hypothetical protein